MKILLATYWSVPHLGGVWSYIVQLKKTLESHGHEVDVLGYGEDNNSVHIVNENRKIEKDKLLPLLRAKMNPQNYPAIYANKLVEYTEFQRYIFELGAVYLGLEKYDLIHTQDVISTACIARVKPASTPLVATLHGSVAYDIRHQLKTTHKSENSYLAQAYYDELERVGATSADVTIVANKWLKNNLTNEFRVPANQIRVLHYGFDTDHFIQRMKQSSPIVRPKEKKVILFSGRLIELKGVHHLLSALEKLKKMRKDWVCWIIGSGENESEFQNQSKELGLQDDVLFFGRRDDVPYLMANSDIYVHPSLIDNQPLSLIEAQIAGKPAIVTDVGGLPEMVEHMVTGLITPVGDTKKLCENLNLLLANVKLRRNLGYNAKKWGMSYWSVDKGVRGLLDIYKDVISKREKGGNSDSVDTIH